MGVFWDTAHSWNLSSTLELCHVTCVGKAVFLARDKHHLADLCHLIRHEAPYLFQEYVKESHGRDVRVVLVGGRVIGSMLRCSTDGRMQSNCSLGKTGKWAGEGVYNMELDLVSI